MTLAMPGIVRAASADTIKIGYISPLTGPYALFGETDKYTVDLIKKMIGKGIQNNGKTYNVEIFVRDAQSNSEQGRRARRRLDPQREHPFDDPGVDDAGHQSGRRPVRALWRAQHLCRPSPGRPSSCRAAAPRSRSSGPTTSSGASRTCSPPMLRMWKSVDTNKKVGMLFPRNADGEAWGNDNYGLPPASAKAGFEAIAPSMFQPHTNDFSAQIAEFKRNNCDIVGGISYPGDLKTFITQCSQQNYHPKVVTIAAALLFPSGVEAMGRLGDRHELGGLVDAGLPVQVVADRPDQRRHRREMGEGQPARSGPSRSAIPTRCGKSPSIILKRSKNPLDRTANRDSLKETRPANAGRARPVQERTARRTSARRRSSAASGSRERSIPSI